MASKNVAPAPQEQTSVRLYGILQESPPGNSHISVQYCGFKTSTDEVRIGSARTFMIEAEHATQDGVVAGFGPELTLKWIISTGQGHSKCRPLKSSFDWRFSFSAWHSESSARSATFGAAISLPVAATTGRGPVMELLNHG